MKRLAIIAFMALIGNTAIGQCLPDRHNTSWFNGWISCETSENPNELRGESHWISYDFGQPYVLNELKIWNVNDPDILDYGAKIVAIDYSLDGVNWIEYGEVTFPMAPGQSDYEGDVITDLGGIEARHVIFTVLESYGATCTGFSEMRVAADNGENENEDICIIADIYPNPFNEEFSVYLEKNCLSDVYMAVEDATGRTVIQEEIIKLYDTKVVNAENLTAGVYFVCLRTGDIKQRYKIVKY